jgi:hypothetical protein
MSVSPWLTENIKFRINETAHRLTDLPSEPKWKGNVFFCTLRLDLRAGAYTRSHLSST